jgi:hypothetical protein
MLTEVRLLYFSTRKIMSIKEQKLFVDFELTTRKTFLVSEQLVPFLFGFIHLGFQQQLCPIPTQDHGQYGQSGVAQPELAIQPHWAVF